MKKGTKLDASLSLGTFWCCSGMSVPMVGDGVAAQSLEMLNCHWSVPRLPTIHPWHETWGSQGDDTLRRSRTKLVNYETRRQIKA